MAKNTSPHILGTSANLLGFCLFVITSLKIRNQAESSHIDEFTSVVAMLLGLSCFFSFIAIRTANAVRGKLLEKIADNFFVVALAGILIIILLITFNFIK